MLNLNEPIKVAHLQTLANQSKLNWPWSLNKARNVLIEKMYIILAFFKKWTRIVRLLMFRSDLGRRDFILNLLQKCSIGTRFG